MTKILLIAGQVRTQDRLGHHDYAATCALLADMLWRVPGIEPVVVHDGWPAQESMVDAAAALFYDGGAGKQGFLQDDARIAQVEQLADRGAGLVMLHQSVAFPRAHAARGKQWLGGVYEPGKSARGHWKSEHRSFPAHPVTTGVTPWKFKDGWLNRIQFVDALQGVVPLLWSGRRHAGASTGGDPDIVAWAYTRPQGGRSFAFTGLDAHSAWSHAGLRRLIANGLVWSAGLEVPTDAAWTQLTPAERLRYLTPRKSRVLKVMRSLGRKARRAVTGQRKW